MHHASLEITLHIMYVLIVVVPRLDDNRDSEQKVLINSCLFYVLCSSLQCNCATPMLFRAVSFREL